MKYRHQSEFIKVLRSSLGISQSEMARQFDVGTQFISNCERGLAPIPVKRLKSFLKQHQGKPSKKQSAQLIINSYLQAACLDLKETIEAELLLKS